MKAVDASRIDAGRLKFEAPRKSRELTFRVLSCFRDTVFLFGQAVDISLIIPMSEGGQEILVFSPKNF